MRSLAILCRQAGTSMSDLSKTMGIPERTLNQSFSTGLIPYVLVHKVAEALNMTVQDVVTPGLIQDWIELYDAGKRARKPRGASAQRNKMYSPEQAQKEFIAKVPDRDKMEADLQFVLPLDLPEYAPAVKKLVEAIFPTQVPKKFAAIVTEAYDNIDLSALADLQQEAPRSEEPTGPPAEFNIRDDAFKMTPN